MPRLRRTPKEIEPYVKPKPANEYWCLADGTVEASPCPRCGAFAPFAGRVDPDWSPRQSHNPETGHIRHTRGAPFSGDAA